MGKTHSKPLAAWQGNGMAGERHGRGMLCVNPPYYPGIETGLRGEMPATNSCVTEDPRLLERDAVSTGK
jgi:hypothetical protein